MKKILTFLLLSSLAANYSNAQDSIQDKASANEAAANEETNQPVAAAPSSTLEIDALCPFLDNQTNNTQEEQNLTPPTNEKALALDNNIEALNLDEQPNEDLMPVGEEIEEVAVAEAPAQEATVTEKTSELPGSEDLTTPALSDQDLVAPIASNEALAAQEPVATEPVPNKNAAIVQPDEIIETEDVFIPELANDNNVADENEAVSEVEENVE